MVTFCSHVALFCAECAREAPSVEHERNLSAEDAPAGIDRKTKGIKIAGTGITQTSTTTSEKGETRTQRWIDIVHIGKCVLLDFEGLVGEESH